MPKVSRGRPYTHGVEMDDEEVYGETDSIWSLHRQVADLTRERDEARAECERLRETNEAIKRITKQWRIDAERYRWLRHHYTAAVKFAHPKVIVIDDASIDEAMEGR